MNEVKDEMEERKNQLLAANKARALDLLTSISLQLSNQVDFYSFSHKASVSTDFLSPKNNNER